MRTTAARTAASPAVVGLSHYGTVLASWPGVEQMGMVEWLFTRKKHRRRGVATALIAHAVADARAQGAREVLIGASAGADAVPRQLYASLGFRPVCVTEEYLRFV